MLKGGTYSLRGAVAALLLWCGLGGACSCTLAERYDDTLKLRLTFDPVLYSASKAEGMGEYPEGVDFGVDVWDYPSGGELGEASAFLSRERVSCISGEWTTVPSVNWPSGKRQLAVLAHSPFGWADRISLSSGVEFRNVDTYSDQTDLLYMELSEGLDKSQGGTVSVPFRHALCYVDFAIRSNASASESVNVQQVSLASLRCSGSFSSLPEASWTVGGPFREVLFYNGLTPVGQDNTRLPGGRWTIPQGVNSVVRARIQYVGSNGVIHLLNLESDPLVKTLEAGRHYTVVLSFNPDGESLILDDTVISSNPFYE